jgi:hypothetical protein
MFHDNPFIEFAGFICCVILIPTSLILVLAGVDYLISADATVNAINQECGTEYVRLDYLRVGKDTMLTMCETRQKRIELIR